MMEPCELGAAAIAGAIDAGTLTAEAVVRSCLERIEAREPAVRAWTHVAREASLAAAQALDRGPRRGLLHGVPVGIKDIIDTADQPSEYGSPIWKGHVPGADAATVALPRAAGAVILGKTVTTEFANRFPGPTGNPHDPRYTPGGSSSGSAAAVADRHVPLATGTQTGGSVLRPAAYCGVYGFKPTFGHFPPGGMKANTEWLDTIGVMARSVEDVALFRAATMAIAYAPPTAPDAPPRVGICRTPHWDEALPEGKAAVEAAAAALARAGASVREAPLPEICDGLAAAQRTIGAFEGVRTLAHEIRTAPEKISRVVMQEKIAVGRAIGYDAFCEARRLAERCRREVDAMMEGFDVLLTPSAPGEAPWGLHDTGPANFNYIWTHLHMPAITMPGWSGPNGLPVGVQLVARRHRDAQLLDVAQWAAERLG